MKRGIGLILILSLLPLARVSAGDGYKLHNPTPEEYLTALPEIVDAGNSEMPDSRVNQSLSDVLSNEIRWRYPNLSGVDADLLYNTYQILLNRIGLDERDFFASWAITSWLNQHHTDLDAVNALSIHEFQITVTPRNYSGDGQNEWLLKVEGEFFSQLIVVARNNNGYWPVDSPLPWFGCCYPHSWDQSGFAEEQFFGDMTGDNIPEWVVAVGGILGGRDWYGDLYVLQWQDGRLAALVTTFYHSPSGGIQNPLFPAGVEVHLSDIDHNGTIEVLIDQSVRDTLCTFHDVRIFAWNSKDFELADHKHEFISGTTTRCYDWESSETNPTVTSPQQIETLNYAISFLQLNSMFASGEYQKLVDLTPTDLSAITDPEELMAVRYYRALAYEALNRPEESLAEYISIYESAPDSAWGMLAALHLE